MDDKNTEPEVEQIQVLPLVALRDTVIFPEMIVPLQVGRDRSVKALDRAVRTSQPVALITKRSNETEEVNSVDELYSIGTLAKIAQVIRLQDGTIRAIVQGQRRIRLLDHGAKGWHGPLDPIDRLDEHSSAADMAASFATDLDRDLVPQSQCFDRGIERGSVGPRIDECAKGHVA